MLYIRLYCNYCRNVALPLALAEIEGAARDGATYHVECSACGEPLVTMHIDAVKPKRERLSDRVNPKTPYIIALNGEHGHEVIQ